MDYQEKALATARFWQPLACLGLLAAIGLSILGLLSAIHNEVFGIWMDRKWAEVNETSVEYRRQYLDTEDRVVLQEVADLDPSAGGVYFFGASNMKWSMCAPDLPPQERKLVHNLGAGEGSPYFHRQFTEFLVEHKGLLRAGPDRTLIVYGASFINAKPAVDNPTTVFSNLWRRYGLYRYDFQTGIEPLSRGVACDAWLLEKARAASFVQGLIDRGERMAVPKALRRRNTDKDPLAYAAAYKTRMGPDWEEEIRQHRRELQEWFDYVRAKGMDFEIVLMPLASWHQAIPHPAKYQEMIEEFCKTNHVTLIDCSKLLPDDDFLDHIHVNAQGLTKIDSALMDVARKFLREKCAWPD
jgi:hypothetical protein